MPDTPDSHVRIEPATPGDATTLAQIQKRAFEDEVKSYGKGPPGFDIPQAQIRAMQMATYYKILVGDAIAGGLIVRAKDQPAGHFYLIRMFLDPDFQNRGIGAQAFAALEQKYPTAAKWSLDTPHRSLRNHHFYEKLGFVKVGQTDPSQHPDMADPDFHLTLFEKSYP